MIDPTYVTQAMAWLAVWSAGGLTARNYLAERERERRQSGGAKRPAPAGKR